MPAELTVESLRDALTRVLDPEAGMNIVDLGLVYAIRLLPGRIEVDLTMTTPACPMGEMIIDDARGVIGALAGDGTEIVIRLVWEPPWNPALMSDRARRHFGWQ